MKFLNKAYIYFRCIPKTLFFNFYYFSFRVAIKIPVLVSHRTSFQSIKGNVLLPINPRLGKIKLGFGSVQVTNPKQSKFIWNVEKSGVVIFGSNNKIGTGCKVHVKGSLELCDNVNFTGEATIICHHKIFIGSGSLVSWQTILSDTDFHPILNSENVRLNQDREIIIGNKVWICMRATILKGVSVGDNSIVSASGTVINGKYPNDVILGGNPAKIIGSMEGKRFTD